MSKRRILQALKLIGVGLFVFIISQIDIQSLRSMASDVSIVHLLVAYILMYCIYGAKTIRWHLLVKSAGVNPSFRESWHLYNIGVFLALVTPAKLGELGRAAYLRNAGMHGATAVSLVILDRLADVAVISMIAVFAVLVLFGTTAFIAACAAGIIGLCILAVLRKKITSLLKKIDWLAFLKTVKNTRVLSALFLSTLLSWALYFVWATILARGVGITTPVHILISTFTVTGILALVPIAPSGLGTRDAALLTLLAPYGVQGEQAVLLALLMFAIIIFSGILGLWYWLTKPVSMKG